MRSTNINFKRGILFFVYNATCWLENVWQSTHVFCIWNLFSNCLLFCSLGRLRQLLLSLLIGQRERESEREKEREGKREDWEAMDSGIAFLGRGGSKDQDFCWGVFTGLSKGGDTTPLPIQKNLTSKRNVPYLELWT